MKQRIDFFFDYISHNAYIAWLAVFELAEQHRLEVRPVPVLFAGLLEAHGQLGPAEVPAKARWMGRDVVRKALDHGFPLAPPASHPFNPLLPLRVSSLPLELDQQRTVIDALFRATWAESRDVSAPAVVADVLDQVDLDGRALVEAATRDEAKRRLRESTERAVERSVFGVPSMIVATPDGEGERLFWGYDDLPNLDRFLRGDDPVEDYDWSTWRHVRPSARRPRKS